MSQIFPLSPIDHVFTGAGSYPIEFIFFYPEKPNFKKMQTSLLDTIKIFPVISSRLVRLSESSFGLETNDEGLVFSADSVAGNFRDIEEKKVFIDPVESVPGEPLAKIKLTETLDGSVLGVSISHCITDGYSYFYFLSSWARLFNGKPFHPPYPDRSPLIPSHDPGIPGESAVELVSAAGLFLGEKRQLYDRTKLKWETVSFSNADLKKITEETQRFSTVRLSYNDLVTAYVWKEYVPRWNKKEDRTCMSCPVDFRRLLEGFPVNYFGNAVVMANTFMEVGELAQKSLPEIAVMIRTAVAGIKKETIVTAMNSLQALALKEKTGIFEKIHVVQPSAGMLVTNLSRLPLQEMVFEGSPPQYFDILTQARRGAVVLPATDGLDIRVIAPVD